MTSPTRNPEGTDMSTTRPAAVTRRITGEAIQLGATVAMVVVMLGAPFLQDGPLVRWVLLAGATAAAILAIVWFALLVQQHLAYRRRQKAEAWWEANRIHCPLPETRSRTWS